MFISFRCPCCGHKLRASDRAAGKRAKCKCGQVVLVPTISVSASQDAIPSQAVPLCPAASTARAAQEPQSQAAGRRATPEHPKEQIESHERAKVPFKSKLIAAVIGLAILVCGGVFEKVLPRVLIKALPKLLSGEQYLAIVIAILVAIVVAIVWTKMKTRGDLLAKSLKAPLGDEIVERDGRPPIVYLRSFADDTSLYPEHEQELVAALSPFGPVIAIGRPGEYLQTLGAARVYLGDDWQEQIHQWIEICALVVIRIGTSEGLRWEIDTVINCLKGNRLLLQVPRVTSRNAAVLVDKVVRTITCRNQERDYDDVNYIYFDNALTPCFVKGPLRIPKPSARDAHCMQLREFYKQMFSDGFDNYLERKDHATRRNRRAIAAFECGLVSFFPCLGLVFGPAALILGILGLRYVKANPKVKGTGYAIAGIIMGALTSLGNWGMLIATLVM